MVNRDLLKKSNITSVSKKLGLTRQGLYNKIKRKYDFTETEIEKLIELFGDEILRNN